MNIRLLAVLAATALLTGCATMNESECRTANWFDVGMRDGLNGEPASRLYEHNKSCSEFGIRPQEQRYSEGRNKGLREYCRLGNAFETGLKGQQYKGVCPAAIDLQFRRYNDTAYQVYRLRNDTESARYRLEDKKRHLHDKNLTDEQHDALRREIRDLDRQFDRLSDDLRTTENELDRMMDEARYGKRAH
jgi:hypothetical protein